MTASPIAYVPKAATTCVQADVGQDEDFAAAKAKAQSLGASDCVIKDMRKEFITQYVWPAVQANLVYEDRYLLGTALARPCISRYTPTPTNRWRCNMTL